MTKKVKIQQLLMNMLIISEGWWLMCVLSQDYRCFYYLKNRKKTNIKIGSMIFRLNEVAV